MGYISCEAHQALKNYPPLKVVRIKAEAFKHSENGRFTIRIRRNDKSQYFEAEYADDAYMRRWRDKSKNFADNLIFMNKSCRDTLGVEPYDRVEVEEIQKEELKSLYFVHTALSDDSNEGWIWIKPSSNNKELREGIGNNRRLVWIKKEDARPVYVEALYADNFYLETWKEKGKEFKNDCNFIFISGWYRRLLRIEGSPSEGICNLEVKLVKKRNLCALLYKYPRDHPQALVLTSSMLGLIGVGLGVLGIGLGIISIWDLLSAKTLVLIIFVIAGLVFILSGIIGLIFRR